RLINSKIGKNGRGRIIRCFGNYAGKSNGWGTWIRTKTNGVRVRCSTLKLSPSRDSQMPSDWRLASVIEAFARSRRPPSSELKHRTQYFSSKKITAISVIPQSLILSGRVGAECHANELFPGNQPIKKARP